MYRTLVVGLGRAGTGLHLPTLDRLRKGTRAGTLFAGAPMVAVDPVPAPATLPPGTVRLPTLELARAELDPQRTVVHVCTPPDGRDAVIERLARLGFVNLLVEKPLTADTAQLTRIEDLRRQYGLRLVVVAQWLVSSLTGRLKDHVATGEFGALRAIRVVQRKPRFSRSLATSGHPTAFDVEIPHALGVALDLAGPARLTDAAWSDLRTDVAVRPRLGTATLRLTHEGGASTRIASDLTAPVRERRITCEFTEATVVGHYPISQDDGFAQLAVEGREFTKREVFPDDALPEFFRHAYQRFADGGEFGIDLAARTVRLVDEAKQLCLLRERPTPLPAGAVRDAG
ncbi:Gfo/Idh/MocA family oxidoreductase [Streptomyces antnestii]|uniref:Gfo/Idh/MocA family oxidoreductase n=1 Tax=Streptomyces antnestii TaxID=2494256 RepID=A0A437PN18_9ACTN|nr:Gfo/Idh/MocA family oxidoreductase [Streptomyces sp. San01]RVU23681.1 Gfo/Idh/MocA family oxidoreductase [Streptomyces sp. San01]